MSAIDHEPFPKGALFAAGSLIALSLTAAAVGRYQNLNPPTDAIVSAPIPSQLLKMRFNDEPDGSVIVLNADTGATIDTIAPGEDAFIRAVMRGFVRDRKLRKIGAEVPFNLSRYPNKRLTMSDPTTGKEIDLRAFGPTNEGAFARFLAEPGSR
ncbi:photosynthetic complex assembly protein PuhC [Aquidulcibacter paucihalophilus]|uniref:photosynthetic complex assembly protein PuhC n=1 Tax=Aquidulcibacter paucihalophilus TaxID=1978549 RepID=UPI000A18FC83|nr:photosynthetic complex assembly protein PuhC [Aquidulcibacter paucihalophilus]